eukprot:c41098_g1_i1 orf=24-221(-)
MFCAADKGSISALQGERAASLLAVEDLTAATTPPRWLFCKAAVYFNLGLKKILLQVPPLQLESLQ